MVYSGQHISGVEGEWVFVVDSRQSHVSLTLIAEILIDSFPNLQLVQEKAFFGTRFHNF